MQSGKRAQRSPLKLCHQIEPWDWNSFWDETAMKFLLLSALLGAAALLFHEASSNLYYGAPWAISVCSTSQMLCKHPEYLVYGAGGMVALLLMWKIAGASQ
jgi:hypothetical protein